MRNNNKIVEELIEVSKHEQINNEIFFQILKKSNECTNYLEVLEVLEQDIINYISSHENLSDYKLPLSQIKKMTLNEVYIKMTSGNVFKRIENDLLSTNKEIDCTGINKFFVELKDSYEMYNSNNELGKMVKARRQIMRYSQDELAQQIDCTKQTISKIERGGMEASREILEKIAEVLECTTDYLKGLSKVPKQQHNGLIDAVTFLPETERKLHKAKIKSSRYREAFLKCNEGLTKGELESLAGIMEKVLNDRKV